jgi:hypothetical protein
MTFGVRLEFINTLLVGRAEVANTRYREPVCPPEEIAGPAFQPTLPC